MPSSEKLFTLDPVKTSLTKTTTDVKVQGPANRTVENSQLLKGVQTFSSAVGSLAEVKKQKQIADDTLLANNAAIRGEAEPAGIFGIASESYDRIVEANTLTKASRDMQAFIDGSEGADLVNATGSYSENVAAADKAFDTFKAYGASSYLNPQLLNEFYSTVETKRNEVKIEIAKVNKERNRSQVIQRIVNVVDTVVDVSKDIFQGGVESDSSDIEGTDEYPILFSLDSNITPELVNTLAADTVALNMGLELPEAQRLVMQVFLQNETVIAQPSLADKLMSSEYSPGVTYEALYIKGSLASNKDKDAADIFKMRNAQISATNAHFENLDKQDEDDAKKRTARGKEAVANSLKGGGSNEDAYGTGVQFGLAIQDVTKLITAQESFEGNVKLGLDSPQGISLMKQIANGGVTPEDIAIAIHDQNLDPGDEEFYKVLASKEKTQTLAAQKSYDSQIKIVKSNTLQLLKGALNNNSAVTLDENGKVKFDLVALAAQAVGGSQGLDSAEVQDVMVRLQTLQNDYEYRSNEAAREVARSDTFDRAAVTKFGDDYNNAVALFISDLKKNIISSSAAKKERKKEADKAAADKVVKDTKVGDETKDKVETILPPPLSTKDQIENLTELKTDSKGLIDRLLEDSKILYDNLQVSKPKEPTTGADLISPKEPVLSPGEQTYLDTLTKEAPEVTGQVEGKQPRTTGLGPAADAIDSFFDKVGDNANFLVETLSDMQREKFFYNTFKEFFSPNEAGAADSSTDGFDPDAPGPSDFNDNNDPTDGEITLTKGPPLVLREDTGKVTSEGRRVYKNNLGGESSEYTIGVKNSKINNGELTHIPSIYKGKLVTEEEAIRIISENDGVDPETGRFITAGGDPEARSKAITSSKNNIAYSSFGSSGTEFTRSMANLPTNHKFMAESEFSKGNFKDLGSKPYVSSILAGELNLKGKARSITDVKDVPNTNSIHGDKVKAGKTGLTIGFGHDISPQELKSGEIHGVPFVKDGKFIDVGVEALTEIFNADFEHHKGRAERTFNSKVGNSVGYKFEELPTEVQDFMTDIDFNMGLTKIPKSLAIIKSIISTALRTKRGITEVSMEPVLNVLEKEIKERDTKNPESGVQRRSNKAFKDFRTREGLKSLFKLKGN